MIKTGKYRRHAQNKQETSSNWSKWSRRPVASSRGCRPRHTISEFQSHRLQLTHLQHNEVPVHRLQNDAVQTSPPTQKTSFGQIQQQELHQRQTRHAATQVLLVVITLVKVFGCESFHPAEAFFRCPPTLASAAISPVYLPMPDSSGAKLIPWRRICKTNEKDGVEWKARRTSACLQSDRPGAGRQTCLKPRERRGEGRTNNRPTSRPTTKTVKISQNLPIGNSI